MQTSSNPIVDYFQDHPEQIEESSIDPLLSATAEASRAVDCFLVDACDGNATAGKIVTIAMSVKKTAELLGRCRASAGDLAILNRRLTELRACVSRAEGELADTLPIQSL